MAAGKLTSRFGDGNSSVGGSWDRGPFGAATSGFSPGPRFCCFRRHHTNYAKCWEVHRNSNIRNPRSDDSMSSADVRTSGVFQTSSGVAMETLSDHIA